MTGRKKILFLTGTRADFGKLKPLMNVVEESDLFDCYIFVTGMHTLKRYGYTYLEVEKQGYKNITVYDNRAASTEMDVILANTITGFSDYVKKIQPDMIVVHGDRVEPMAGAIVGSINNILTAHVEGGEISGTIDELLRHSISKLSHVHFVANQEARKRLIQMGEKESTIFIIGSPDIDIMKSATLPSVGEMKTRYQISFDSYAVFIYHPVTTEVDRLQQDISETVASLIDSGQNYVVIYPNNDKGSEIILEEYQRLEGNLNFRVLPSMRFEFFLTLLKNARFIIGNSSAGVREAEIYGIPAVNIGTRQDNRTKSRNVINAGNDKNEILQAIIKALKTIVVPVSNFGDGKSYEKFYQVLTGPEIWDSNIQKQFSDLDF
jgi:UDP-N-acetylglucosamine 2-epimerase (hydrolysing)